MPTKAYRESRGVRSGMGPSGDRSFPLCYVDGARVMELAALLMADHGDWSPTRCVLRAKVEAMKECARQPRGA